VTKGSEHYIFGIPEPDLLNYNFLWSSLPADIFNFTVKKGISNH